MFPTNDLSFMDKRAWPMGTVVVDSIVFYV